MALSNSWHVLFVELLLSAPLMCTATEKFTRRSLEDCNPGVFHIQNKGTDDCIALRSHAEPSGRTEPIAILEDCDSDATRQQWSQIEEDFLVRSSFDSSQCLFPSHASRMIVLDCDNENREDASWQKYSDGTIRNIDIDEICWDQQGEHLVLSECLTHRQQQLWTSFLSKSSCQDSRTYMQRNSTDSTNSTNLASNSSGTNDFLNPQFIEDDVNAMGPWGIVYFALIYVAIEIFCIPAIPLTITSGYLFGVWKGTAVVVISAGIAAAIAFNVGRTLLRSYVLRKLESYPKLRRLDKAVGKEGFRVILLIQMSPFFPFAMGNYFYGTTSVNFWAYWCGTVLGITPGSFAYCYSGHVGQALLSDGLDAAYPWYVYLIILLMIFLLLHFVATTATKIIERINEDEEDEGEPLVK